jgi:hypothetical protein
VNIHVSLANASKPGIGQYVINTSDGLIGFIFADKEGRYEVAVCERDEERRYSASELIPWVPKAGERVTEINNEDGAIGIVVEAGETISLVKWDNLNRHVSWVNSSLEPVWS